ncbi:MAG: response regulator [Candidatus Buchananbacteria bacterium]
MTNSKPKILLIEDDQSLSDMYTMKFSSENMDFLKADNGEDGLTMAKAELPDLILLDIMMPKMDGFAVLTELKADAKTKNIPVLVLSNLGQKSDIEKGEKLGATGYVVKATMTPTQVVAKVKETLTK